MAKSQAITLLTPLIARVLHYVCVPFSLLKGVAKRLLRSRSPELTVILLWHDLPCWLTLWRIIILHLPTTMTTRWQWRKTRHLLPLLCKIHTAAHWQCLAIPASSRLFKSSSNALSCALHTIISKAFQFHGSWQTKVIWTTLNMISRDFYRPFRPEEQHFMKL